MAFAKRSTKGLFVRWTGYCRKLRGDNRFWQNAPYGYAPTVMQISTQGTLSDSMCKIQHAGNTVRSGKDGVLCGILNIETFDTIPQTKSSTAATQFILFFIRLPVKDRFASMLPYLQIQKSALVVGRSADAQIYKTQIQVRNHFLLIQKEPLCVQLLVWGIQPAYLPSAGWNMAWGWSGQLIQLIWKGCRACRGSKGDVNAPVNSFDFLLFVDHQGVEILQQHLGRIYRKIRSLN